MALLRILFPFTIKGSHPEIGINTSMERQEDLVSFGLAYDIDILIENAELKSKEEVGSHFIYVYKFASLNDAMNFMDIKRVKAAYNRRLLEVEVLEKEMDRFMERYELGEKQAKRKKKMIIVTGEDGFMKYA